MSLAQQSIQEKIILLSPDQQSEVIDLIEFLLSKKKTPQSVKMKLDWAGALKHLRDKYTSVELQHSRTGILSRN